MKKIKTEVIEDVICDVCNQSCKKEYSVESANIKADWGYESNRDLERFDIDLCEECFNKTLTFLNNLCDCGEEKIKPMMIDLI